MPNCYEAQQGPDATLFVYQADEFSLGLGRREEALGDEPEGVQLSEGAVARSRPSVSGDGEFAAFVNADNDICLVPTDGSDSNLLEVAGVRFQALSWSVYHAFEDGVGYRVYYVDASPSPVILSWEADEQPTPAA